MFSVLRNIWILVIIQIIRITRCQDGFSEQDFLRLQRFASNDGKINSLTFNSNILQSDPNTQSLDSTNVQYQLNEDTNENNNFGQRSPYTRNKKVYRIKNPFQNHFEETGRQLTNTEAQDSGTGASNEYASMQYSLPPEEFLQQLRAENQYYQQTQISTPSPNLGYTATPLPQYQYSTTAPSNYESNNQPNNQISLEPKASHGPTYLSSPSPYQYSTVNTFLDNVQSTPSPVPSYLSTPLNNGQYSSQTSSYVSSSSPVFLSSSPNQQAYVSSPYSIIQTGSPDYNNRVTTTIGNNPINYDNNDYSAGRYSLNMQQQYQTDYKTTTTTTQSPYTDQARDSWQNNMNSASMTAAPKSIQENVYSSYQNYPYQSNQQDSNSDNLNSETHRIGGMASANNLYFNYVQPDSQVLNNMKLRTRDLESETNQQELYSNGDFGWKLSGKKPLIDLYSSANYPRYTPFNMGSSEGSAISQVNFHMDTGKPYNYNQISKSATESIEAQEFAQAAAKAHERLKQQQQQQQQQHQQQQQQQQHQQQQMQLQQQQQQQQQFYTNNNNYGLTNNADLNSSGLSSYYSSIDKPKNKYNDNSNNNQYFYTNSQNDLITVSPYYISTQRDNSENRVKQPFDHDKALKNIVPIDMSNVVSNSDSRTVSSSENIGHYSTINYDKDQLDQNVKHYIRPVTDSFYKDKNSIYGFNIKAKGDEFTSDNYKQLESKLYGKQDSNYNQGYSGPGQSISYLAQPSTNYQDSLQSSSIQLAGLHRGQNQAPSDIASILKFSDVPYKLTQGLSSDALKLHNLNFDQSGIPTPLPMRINQNVESHQIDVTTNLLNKLFFNKQPTINRPEIDSQTGGLLSTINGFKVANPFNVDLKLVAEMLKGKPTVDDSHMMSLRDQYTKPAPLKLDLSQLQLLLKSDNNLPIQDGLSGLGGSYIDLYNNGRFPYQGVKYSRSQEEEEPMIPIADASNTHPIGAVIEQDDTAGEREVSGSSDLTAQDDDAIHDNFEENRPKTHFLSGSRIVERHRRPNLLYSGKHSYPRKHPKSDLDEPYPLLKPPPPHHTPRANRMKVDNKHNRRRRVHKIVRIKTEPLFEAGAEPESLETSMPTLLRPPPPVAETKSDTVDLKVTA